MLAMILEAPGRSLEKVELPVPIPTFPYQILWSERVVRSVANLTRSDGEEFLALAPQIPIHTEVTAFPLTEANRA